MMLFFSRKGQWLWVPPEGDHLVAEDPQEVRIVDVVGDQQGTHQWADLRSMMAGLLKKFRGRIPRSGHECDVCRRNVEVNGEAHSMKVAVVDGCNNTKHPKCKACACPEELESVGGAW